MSLRAFAAAAILSSALSLSPMAHPQSIDYRPDAKVWVIQAGDFTYAMGVDERNWLQSLYWGPRIDRTQDIPAAHSLPERAAFDLSTTTTPQEYAAWGAGLYTEPDLKATFASGNRDVVLEYVDQHLTRETNSQTLEITMRDIKLPLVVHLFYRVYNGQSILERWSTIENQTKEDVVLENAASATWSLPNLENRNYRAHWLTGRWAGEWQLQSASARCRQPGHREPPRLHRQSGQSLVRPRRPRQHGRRARPRLLRRARLERKLAHHHGAELLSSGSYHRRLQSIRLRIPSRAWRIARPPRPSMPASPAAAWVKLRASFTAFSKA